MDFLRPKPARHEFSRSGPGVNIRGARQPGALPRGLGRLLLPRRWRVGRKAGVLLGVVAPIVLAAPVPAGAAAPAAVSHAAPDRAPAEVALLGVCFAVLIAVVAVVIRRSLVRRRFPRRVPLDAVRAVPATPAQPDAADVAAAETAAEVTAAGRGAAEPQAAPAGENGPGSPRLRAAVLASVGVLLAGGIAAVVVLGSGQSRAGRGNSASPLPGQPAATNVPTAASSGPGKHRNPRAGQSPGHRSGAAASDSGSDSGSSSTPAPTGPTTSAPTSPPHTTPPSSSAGTLSIQPSGLIPLTGEGLSTTYTGSFTITAVGGPVSGYTVTELSSETGDITFTIANASHGPMQAGQTETVTVGVPAVVSFTPYVVVDPGGTMVGFTYPPGASNGEPAGGYMYFNVGDQQAYDGDFSRANLLRSSEDQRKERHPQGDTVESLQPVPRVSRVIHVQRQFIQPWQ
jgi:hypothetical protein